ncbi:unnamed protein product [Eruca vesicaria subsp. sativa]|uniref:Cysteine-rich receptor-like protein kinase 10 n=1 Tax=Eruca vesicaria subsp. sativa TaxID=29727 RepID=A0ABC8KYA4_ERUVS|nr:unnamed protein product [Eruca vesicaria subsp. sativa]
MASCIFLFLFSFLTIYGASAQNPNFLFRSCPNTTKYSRNSTYLTNLRTLLSSLPSRNASYTIGFQNTSAGQAPNRVYGLFLCRGDISPEVCRNCVAFSVNETLTLCPSGKEAVIYYDECMLRYSHKNIFSIITYEGGLIMLNANNISSNQADRFEELVSSTMNQAASEAANNSRKFFTIKANFTTLQSLDFSKRSLIRRERLEFEAEDEITTIESLQLDYRTIQAATNNYSENNKIGRGGFGAVYKGTFSNGTEVAVKRLSKSSGQGDTEFKNEVVVVAKLQHKNLVRLLGFSLNREERILVYEYVPNKSLDCFLFDPAKQSQLNWTRRYTIIGGIARGILYLHQDSRLTIIHRDLKVSNILLDAEMNPKIADFGMARFFGIDQTQENTSRIVGTYGYMSPEYAMHGHFSMKSDVYSFGVLVLEIISGKKNSKFYEIDGAHDLVTYVWRLWTNGTTLDIVDPAIVVPRQPGFFLESRPQKDPLDTDQSGAGKSVPGSFDDASVTELSPR